MNNFKYPDNFLWGVATAAYQIEGATCEDGRTPSIWDTFCHVPGAVLRGDTGDVACDHYHRWESDLDLLVDLGVNAYRFSVAWPRIMPDGGSIPNVQGLDFYDRLVDELLARGIIPMVTLYHWDLPQRLQDQGGWAERGTVSRFVDFARAVASRLGDRVPYWLTANEPFCATFLGYREGTLAPGVRDDSAALAAVHHLLLAHGRVVQALREDEVKGKVGITLNLTSVRSATQSAEDVAAANRLDLYENRMFLDPLFKGCYPPDVADCFGQSVDAGLIMDGDLATIATPIDFLGINYYERHAVMADLADPRHGWTRVPPVNPTISGIAVEPIGLEEVLQRVARDYTTIPLVITETGRALFDYVDPEGRVKDTERIDFLNTHIAAATRAMAGGVPLIGFFPWSLMDSFEWAWGYGHRFGLYYVDYLTQQRRPKDSAEWYKQWLTSVRARG